MKIRKINEAIKNQKEQHTNLTNLVKIDFWAPEKIKEKRLEELEVISGFIEILEEYKEAEKLNLINTILRFIALGIIGIGIITIITQLSWQKSHKNLYHFYTKKSWRTKQERV